MSFLIYLILSLIIPKSVYAADEFNVSQNITYSVNHQGQATVKQEINLTNNISQIYAKEYQVNLSGSTIHNIQGNDKYGNIIDHITTENDNSSIFLKFSKPVIGKDQTNQFFINYTIADFAKKKGSTWELQFPTISNAFTNQQININLEIPSSFGELSFSSIPINLTHTVGYITQISFKQTQIKNKILLVFGNHQLFDFKLNYYLKNDQNQNITTEIPIPPDTDRQTITFKSIDPPPSNIKVDTDGNWLAQYILSSQQDLNIIVTGQAKIHPPFAIQQPPDQLLHLLTQKYWPTTDPQIINLSSTLNSPKKIYQYVVDNLNYDYENINFATRKGAKNALDFPNQSLCTEFTDLFVTLSRTNKIPAREIEGFAYSNNSKVKPTNPNSDVLHAWPEYFDSSQNRWFQIDPTWEKTTNGIDYFTDLDLNHLTFVIHGLQSDYPPPPGSYKKDKTTKSVFVDFATEELKPTIVTPQLTLTNNQLIIKNPGFSSLRFINLKLANPPWQQTIDYLPPLSSTSLTIPHISIFKSLHPNYAKYKFTIDSSQNTTPYVISLDNKQHYLNLSVVIGITIFLLCIGGIILTISHKSNEKIS